VGPRAVLGAVKKIKVPSISMLIYKIKFNLRNSFMIQRVKQLYGILCSNIEDLYPLFKTLLKIGEFPGISQSLVQVGVGCIVLTCTIYNYYLTCCFVCCDALCLTLREQHRLTVLGNGVLRRIFRPKKEEVARGWREQHNEELHNLYDSLNIVRVFKSGRMRLAGHVVRMGEMKNSYKTLVGKRKGKRPLRRPRHR